MEAKAKASSSFDTFGFPLFAELRRKFNHFQVRSKVHGWEGVVVVEEGVINERVSR